jgi:hypothetical protein
VCKTAKDCETVLVAIPGTEDDGICEARQVHKRCYDLVTENVEDEEALVVDFGEPSEQARYEDTD